MATKKKKKAKSKLKAKATTTKRNPKCVHHWGWNMGTPTTEELFWSKTPYQIEEDHNTRCTVCKETWHAHGSVYYCEFCCKRMGQCVGFPSSLD